ncbi:DDE_Tnp_1-associated family protein [Escherichia coli 2-316-03_S3_C1]|nr:DDE_Tnp_1-associated family protein [Escherichia coli 2-316-03_S3_C1]
MELKKLMEHISIIPDYRQAWKVEHKLSDILLLTICAVISGAEGWEDIEDFGETHLDFLKQYGDFENGIPVHDTIARVVGFAPIFPDICYHLTHYKPAAADIPVASDNPAHYADAIRYNARTPLQGSLLPLTRLVWA